MADTDVDSAVRRAFAGRAVLLTGGTGFIGMLLTEKILRAFPDIKKVYLLTRDKKNMTAAKRVQVLLDNEIFHIVKKNDPDYRQKVVAVTGDTGEIGLALSDNDRRLLTNEVEFIFHSAATVKFADNLKRSVNINVRGTREMILLAKSCMKLRAFVHISTGFCNTPFATTLEEKFYKSHIEPESLITILENVDRDMAEKITPGIIDPFPNTYSLTKNAAENLILKHATELPIAIVRPCLVLNCLREPLPGWTNSYTGQSGIYVATALGILHVIYGHGNVVADLVPAEYVINTCIASAWKAATDGENENKMAAVDDKMAAPTVYSVGTSWRNPVTFGAAMKIQFDYTYKFPLSSAVSHGWLYISSSKRFVKLANIFLMLLPAFIMDLLARVKGEKPKYVSLYRKYEDFTPSFEEWMSKEFIFKDDNTLALYHSMSAVDREAFNCDVTTFDPLSYGEDYVRGTRKYLLKESEDTIPASKKLRRRLFLVHCAMCFVLFSVVMFVLYGLYSTLCVSVKYI